MFDMAGSLARIDAASTRWDRVAARQRMFARQAREMAAERQSDPDGAEEERRRDLEEHGDEA